MKKIVLGLGYLMTSWMLSAYGYGLWKNTLSANTPATAYEWSDLDNWTETDGDWSTGNVTNYPKSKVFITLPANLTMEAYHGNEYGYLLGDVTLKVKRTTKSFNPFWYASYLFGDFIVPEDGSSRLIYLTGHICGHLKHYGTESSQVTVPSGNLYFHYDRFARSAGETRTDDLDDLNYFGIGNGTIRYYMPNYSDESTTTWILTKGSRFAERKDQTAAGKSILSAGTTITSVGYVKSGTYLKNVFNDNWIELSEPAEEGGEAALTFAAFHPNFHITYKNRFRLQGADIALIFQQNDARDNAIVEMPILECNYSKTHLVLGNSETYIPARCMIRSLSGSLKNGYIRLGNAYLILAGKEGETAMNFSEEFPMFMLYRGVTTTLEVPEGMTTTIASMTNLCGHLQKDGAGKLVVGLGDTVGRGDITIKAGTLALTRRDTIPANEDIVFSNLVMAAGTTLEVPSCGIRVMSFASTGAVTIKGGKVTASRTPGETLEVDVSQVTFSDGGSLVFDYQGTAEPLLSEEEGSVVGHPAFWVDASKESSVICTEGEGGVKYIQRWNDCRAEETMFCTNLGTVHATYANTTVYNSHSWSYQKYVKITNHKTNDYVQTEQLAWSVPLWDIKAIFLMHDPVDGGGEILGRCSWRVLNENTWSWGGPFFRGGNLSYSRAVVSGGQYLPPSVQNAKFYLNGETFDATKKGYPSSGLQLIECHVNPNEYSQANGAIYAYGLAADAFGGGYLNGNDNVKASNGGMRISECIIYTNSLTYAERVKVAKYLMTKWLSCSPHYNYSEASFAEPGADVEDLSAMTANDGVGVTVASGRTLVAKSLTTGTIKKEGAGTLCFAEGVVGAGLDVREGTVRVEAYTKTRFLPSGAWLHVDAMEADSITTKDDGETLDAWRNLSSSGGSLRNKTYSDAKRVTKVVSDGINGHPAIDTGVFEASTAGSLIYYTPEGVVSPNYNQSCSTMTSPLLKTMFAVYNSAGGGGTLFGGTGSEYPGKGLMRRADSSNTQPLIFEGDFLLSSYYGMPALSNALVAGTSIYRRNGVDIDPFTSYYLKGDERLAYRHSVGHPCVEFANYCDSWKNRGGLKYGEMILYPDALSDTEVAKVDAYLAKKWFGIENPAYDSKAAFVKVAAGATLQVEGPGFKTDGIGGSGTVTGEVTLNDAGTIYAATDAQGLVSGMTFNGALTVNGGTVILDSTAAEAVPGVYTILSATTLTDKGGTWSVTGSRHRKYRARVVGNTLQLIVREHGTVMIVR